MPLIDLYGHLEIRKRLSNMVDAGSLPGSLLLHGSRGTGKQRIALWLAQLILCDRSPRPCGSCRNCEYSRNLTHPDLHWYFPRPRLKDADPDRTDVRDDYRDAIAERVANGGLYAASPGNEGLYVATVRAIVHEAALSPAIARRKVFVIGDAERMVSQEGSDQAANAFLKLLEEPPENTNIIITSSESGALLPTIRSRTVSVRIPLVAEEDVRAFVADPVVRAALDNSGAAKSTEELVRLSSGAPGTLFGDAARNKAMMTARRMIEAASSPRRSGVHAASLGIGASGARGAFTEILDCLVVILGERMRAALHDGNEHRAFAASRASEIVGQARVYASSNVNPQLITSGLLRDLSRTLQ